MSAERTPRPLRAMLGVHLATHWAASLRQSGRVGRWVRLLLGGSLMLVFLAGVAGGMGLAGWHVDRLLSHRRAGGEALVAGALTAYVLIFGLSAALEGITRRLPWESLRVFPVTTRTLFAAELFASALDVTTALPLLGLLTFCTTASIRNPRATPAYALLFVTHALLLLTVPLVIGGILQRASRRLRLSLTLGLLLIFVLGSTGTIHLADSLPRETFRELLGHTRGVALMMPSHALFAAATDLRLGALTLAGALRAALVATGLTLGLVLAAYWVVAREAPLGRRGDRLDARLWTFRTPVWGIARLQWAMLLGSTQGRFALAFPLFALTFGRLGIAEALSPHFGVTAAFLYCAFGLMGLLSNQFGLDRHGIKALLLLPIAERSLLRGKLLGHALLAAAQALILAALFATLQPGAASAIKVGIVAYGCMFVLLSIVGTPCSVWAARPVRAQGTRARPSLSMFFVLFGAVPTFGLVIGGVLLATAVWLPGWELMVAGALLVALLGLLELLLRASARALSRNREQLVERLSGAA